MAVNAACVKSLQKVWEGLGRECGLIWIRRDVVGVRTTASIWNVPKKCGPHGEFFFFPYKETNGSPQGDGGLWTLYPSGHNESGCCVRFAHDGRRRMPLCRAVAFLRIWETRGGMAAQEGLIGTATSMTGPRARVRSLNTTLKVSLLTSLGRIGQARSLPGGLAACVGVAYCLGVVPFLFCRGEEAVLASRGRGVLLQVSSLWVPHSWSDKHW